MSETASETSSIGIGAEAKHSKHSQMSVGAGAKHSQMSVGGAIDAAAMQALTDSVVNAMLPANGESQAHRDATDAKHADLAFNSILAATAVALETPAMITGILADIGTAGTAAGAHAAVQAAITEAIIVVRALWGRLSFHEKAKIWRGEL